MAYEISGPNCHSTNGAIHNKRLDWVNARKVSTSKYERLSLSLKIANYDYVVTKHYDNKEGKKAARKRITDLRSRLKFMQLKDELKAIHTSRKNQKKQIEYDKKLGYTFSKEVRNDRTYLYREKRGTKHEYVAKDWKDLDTKQQHRADEEVLEEHWALKGLSPSEIETFHIIEKELPKIQLQERRELAERKFYKSLSEEDRIEMEAQQAFIEQFGSKEYVFEDNRVIAEDEPDPTLKKAAKKLGMRHYDNEWSVSVRHWRGIHSIDGL